MSHPLSFEEWCNRINFINPNIDVLNDSTSKGTKEDPYILHCNKCGVTFTATVKTINVAYLSRKNGKIPVEKHWCPACSGHRCFPGYNDIATLRPDLIKYFVDPEEPNRITLGHNGKTWLKCPDCNVPRLCNIYWFTTHGFTCEECSDGISYPNKVCRALLKQLPINNYQFEYIDDWTEGKKYDAYFSYNSIEYLLEFDGSQHYVDSSWGTKEEQQTKDYYKDMLAQNNGFILIRIDCFESDFDYIKQNIFQSKLFDIFDLSVIDWEQCYKDSLKNIIVEVGEYYKNNECPSITSLSKKFHIYCDTITKYLKQAAKIGICDYTPEISKMNAVSNKNIPYMDKSFYAYDPQGNNIGMFSFRSQCSDYIYDNYGIKINESIISRCLWTGMPNNNFRFEFVNGLDTYYSKNEDFYSVIKYYKNTNKTIKDIAKELNISYDKTRMYLIAGTSLGLCDYDDEDRKYRKLNYIIRVFDGDNYIGEYFGKKQCINDLNNKYSNKDFSTDSFYVISRNKKNFNYKGLSFVIENK